MKRVLFLIVLVFGMQNVHAQIDEQAAFQAFKKAREAFQNDNFGTAAELLLETTELLGSTNIRIQPMLITSLVKIEDWRQGKIEINTYYGLNPDQELVEYLEIVNLEKLVIEKIGTEEAHYESATNSKSVSKYQSYLDTFPYGKYRSEVTNQLSDQNDENAWLTAENNRSTASYYDYLDQYPYGSHANMAKSAIELWDNEAYDIAVNDGTQKALNHYLSLDYRSKYRSEIREKLTARIEYDVYAYALDHNYIEDYEAYIKQYPNGVYANEVNTKIGKAYYRFGNEAFVSKKYSYAKDNYEKYLSKYPNGVYNGIVRGKIKKCQRKLNQRSASFIMYTYDEESSIGLGFGDLNTNRLGYYVNYKMNSEIFTGVDVIYKIDDKGEHDRPNDIERTGEIEYGNMSLSFGKTFKLAYPLWGYMGVGLGYYPVYEKVNVLNSSGIQTGTDWLKNTDQTRVGVFPEIGVKLKLVNTFAFKFGVKYQEDVLMNQFGFGFSF